MYGYRNLSEEVVSAVTATNTVKLGERGINNGVEYVYCYNASDGIIYPGNGVIMTANSGYSVVITSVAGDACFGVCVNTTATTNTYFWAAQRGFVKVRMQDLDSAAVAGEGIRLEDSGEFQHIPTGNTATTGATWAYQSCGHLIEDVATGSSGMAYIRCP